MKIQFGILLFMVCLNLSMGLVIGLALPGTEYVQATNPGNSTDYESHFNATQIAEGWQATPFTGIPILGDLFSGLYFLWQNIAYLVDGFPMFLNWISDTYLIDAEARTAFWWIANTLRAIYAILISVMVIEYITGRYMTH